MISPRLAAAKIDALGSALEHGGLVLLGQAPVLLREILEGNLWRDFITKANEPVHYAENQFALFVTTRPLKGLGSNVDFIRDVVHRDTITLDLLDRALQNPAHVHSDVSNGNVTRRPVGNEERYALRRLRRERPDIHARVLAEELSPHAAMIEAGFRVKTFTVPVQPAHAVAGALTRHLATDVIDEVLILLTERRSQ
jgi:hypothetical protein